MMLFNQRHLHLLLLRLLETRLLELPGKTVRSIRALALSAGWVNVTNLIFAKTEDAYHDLFPIKPNNERMHVVVGVFLEIPFNIPPNYFLRNLIFCLKVCPSVTQLFEKL